MDDASCVNEIQATQEVVGHDQDVIFGEIQIRSFFKDFLEVVVDFGHDEEKMVELKFLAWGIWFVFQRILELLGEEDVQKFYGEYIVLDLTQFSEKNNFPEDFSSCITVLIYIFDKFNGYDLTCLPIFGLDHLPKWAESQYLLKFIDLFHRFPKLCF